MGNCLTVEAASADIKNLKVVAEISCSGLHTSKTEVVNIFERWKTQTFKRVNGQTLCAMTHFLTDQEFFWPEGGTLLHWVASLSGSIGGLVILEALESVGVLTPEIVNLPARCIAHRPFSQDPEWPQCVKEAPFQTAITFAIGYGRRGTHEQPRIAEMVAILIKAGATGASRLIHLAVRAGVPTVELLLKNGATLEQRDANQNTPLICACSSDSPLSVVQYLVKQGAKVNVCNHHPKFVPLTPLIATLRSTLSNLFDILETLLSAGADANFTPNGSPPPLYVAMDCHCRKIEIIGRLIKAGADVNAASAGSSPLGKAISMFQYSPELFLFILEAGAKITDDAIFHAAATSAVVIEELLKRGANINITRSGDGQTPLHNAACYGKEDCVVALLKAGANVTAKCAKGLMPLDCATTFQIRTILESALAEKLFRQTQYQEQQKILLLQQQLDTQHKLLALLSSKPAESSPTKLPTSRFNVYSEEQLTYNSIVIAPEEYKPAISCVEELKQNVLPLFISLVPKFPDMLAECPLILSSVQESPQVKDMVSNFIGKMCETMPLGHVLFINIGRVVRYHCIYLRC